MGVGVWVWVGYGCVVWCMYDTYVCIYNIYMLYMYVDIFIYYLFLFYFLNLFLFYFLFYLIHKVKELRGPKETLYGLR